MVAQDVEDMTNMPSKLNKKYTNSGLNIKLSKTKYVCIGGESYNL